MRARQRTGRLVGAVALAATLALGSLTSATPAAAAGVTTHAWMALSAVDRVTSPQLQALLEANLPYVRAGAHFPDSGYVPGTGYGEEAHWQRYVDALAAQVLSHPECADLAAPQGPCAPLLAFLMGIVGHGYGDEVFDWLFEPYVADLEEYYTPASLGGAVSEGGAETQLDIVAIADFGRPTTPNVKMPRTADLLAAFTAAGFTGATADQLAIGQVALEIIPQVEANWARDHIDAVHDAMPWTSHNLVTAPGGVDFAAVAIAAAWDTLWAHLQGQDPATTVSITYPAADQRRIPAGGWERTFQPGSARGRGGARNRITAVLSYAAAFRGPNNGFQPVSDQLPAGAMALTPSAGGDPVPVAAGYPKVVPYGADAGAHLVDLQPAEDLAPCTWYTASVTAALLDGRGQGVTPHSWQFRTGTDADGGRCPDDPYTAAERFVRQVTDDLLGRPATDDELAAATHGFERGRTRGAFTDASLASAEERGRLVTEAYERYLGRAPDPAGLAHWTTKLKTTSLTTLAAGLLASPEVFRSAGGTNAGYVAALYPLVHGRAVDPSGAAHWTRRLDAGLARGALARQLLTSPESGRRTVTAAYERFLGRAPDAAGLAHWTKVLGRGTDARQLWRSIILTPEYDRRAQQA